VSDVSVSGYITISGKALSLKALPVGSIKIFLTGSKTDSCITKDNGSFLFDHLPFGKYQLIPFGKNINFIPEYYSYDWLTESRYNQNITVMSTIYITGKISGIRSNPLKNITIGLSGGNNILTDSTGSFLFSDISEGDYTMIPLDTLYKFYPSKYEYAPLVSYKEEQNFTAKKIINISGQITDFKERPVCDVIIKQANDTTIRKSTDTLGNYSFQNIEAGSYVFTPYKKGCYFNPEKITLMNIDSSIHNLNIKNFFKICGIVMDSAFNPVPNVTLFLSGNLNKTAMTNNTGYFEFINLYSGNYSLALSKDGYRFYKDKINYTDLTTSIETDTFFVKKLPSISGIIRDFKNSPINDVIIAVTGDTAVLFHADGGFNIAGLKEGKYMLTPLKAGIKFKPPSISIDRLENDNNNLNFYGYVTISGKIIDSSQKTIPGILIRLIGERSSTSISDNEGNYYFDSLSFGKYIIIPTDKNLGFKPEQVIYQNLNGSVENLTFVSYSSLLNEVKTNSLIPSSQLLINYPNPFNNSTIIKFSIERESFVTLSIIDMLGREVCKLIDNEFLEANEYRLNWNGGTHINVSSGIYIYSLKIRNGNQTTIFNRKMILLK
jgi:hypothetical protein